MQARPDIIVANERLVTTKCCKRKISYYRKGKADWNGRSNVKSDGGNKDEEQIKYAQF